MPKGAPRARKPARRAAGKRRGAATGRRAAPRGLVVGVALVGALGLTTALLALLSPSPLAPDVVWQLQASSQVSTSALDPVFAPRIPIEPGRWTRIYIHHSNTPGGSASTLADQARAIGQAGPPDHFVIGNGQGSSDGGIEVTRRWADQLPPGIPALGEAVDERWISICLIGDFDRQRPTEAQRASLDLLLGELARRLTPAPGAVVHLERADSAAGIGALFRR